MVHNKHLRKFLSVYSVWFDVVRGNGFEYWGYGIGGYFKDVVEVTFLTIFFTACMPIFFASWFILKVFQGVGLILLGLRSLFRG